MNKFNVIAGIDVSKATLAVCISVKGFITDSFEVTNDAKGLGELKNKLLTLETDRSKILICCENTGKYMSKLALVAQGEDLFLWVVHPMIIANYSTELQRGKTDASDALKIMEFGMYHQQKARCYALPDQVTTELMELFRLRKHLVKQRTMNLNFKKSNEALPIDVLFGNLIINQVIDVLNQKIKDIEKAIKALLLQRAQLKLQYELLMSIPGIGPIIAQHFLLATYGFERFKNWRAFACYIGSAPFGKQSGTSINKKPRTSRKAYRLFKADLHQGVIAVIKKGQFFYEYYQGMMAKKYHHFKAVNNIMNMIIKVAFHVIRSQTPFDKVIYTKNKKSWQNNLVVS
jgi:transposase